MEVILLEGVNKLGGLGDKVRVKPGFARNYLVPQGKAVFATEANLAKFEARRAELERVEAEKLAEAQKRAELLNGMNIVIPAEVSEEGKLFGSVGTRELAEAIAAQGATIEMKEISLPEGVIRFIGAYDIRVSLHSDVHATVHVEITANTTG
jgi:large subunit ribosomal protein L9